MRSNSRMARRAGVAAIAVCAALLIPAVAMAGTARPAAPTRAAAVAKCTAADLDVWQALPGDQTVPGDQGLEHVDYQIQLSNISARPCTLDGFPGVSAISATGRQLGDPAAWDGPKRLITLQYGQTAHFILGVTDVSIFPGSSCDPVPASGLRIYAPGAHASGLDLRIEACSKASPVPYMNVSAVENGAGVPDLDS
jgi:Protein of unknown function (DUF4232)